MATIHQFTPVIVPGDGVSGSVFLTRELLRTLGHQSEIYAWKTSEELVEQVFSLDKFDSASCDLLLFHHSMGHDLEGWLKSTICRRVLVYHNITPSQYFHPGSNEYHYSIKGRQQLQQWRELFSGSISVSPYNCTELKEAGYKDPAVIPLLLDSKRFEGELGQPDKSWQLRDKEILIIGVGRLVENKRQHLLLEAFYHLRKMHPKQAARLVLVGGTTSSTYHHQLLARLCELELTYEVTFTGRCSDAQLRWLLKNATVMWCASEHEGFCIPLVEANFFSLPVVAFATSNIPDTLGKSGIILKEANPIAMASTTVSLLEDTALPKALAKAGIENLQRYTVEKLLPELRNYLETHGIKP